MADTPALLRDISAELNTEFLEREDLIEAVILATLIGEHILVVGPPGTAKTATIDAVTERYTGAKSWGILMDRFIGKEDVFGPVDIVEYKATGNWHRKTDGYFPDAHFVKLDEVGKVGGSISNQLLNGMQERRVTGVNSRPLDIPLISCFGLSNEYLDDPELQAFRDRWLLTVEVDYVKSPGAFVSLITADLTTPNPTTVDLADIEQAKDVDIPAVTVPSGVVDAIRQLRQDLRDEGLVISDRTWRKSMKILRAKAYLEGRTDADEADLFAMRHTLADTPETRQTLTRMLAKLTNPFAEDMDKVKAALAKINDTLDNTPSDELKNQSVGINTEINKAETDLKALLSKAQADGRNVTQIQALEGAVKQTKVRVMTDCLGMDGAMVRKIVLGEDS